MTEHELLKARWEEIVQRLSNTFTEGETLNVDGIIYLIGVQELGQIGRSYAKDEKVDLMHIAICKLLEPFGYYKYEFTELHRLIISHLSMFANSKGRYSNINFITDGATIDPIDEWANIDQYIIEHLLTDYDKKQCKKREKHYQFYNTIPTIALGYESDKRQNINSSDDFFHQYARFELVSGYRVLFLIQIIQKLFNVLEGINTNLPKEFYIWELNRVFSVFFYGTDSEKRKRRNFMR